MVMMPHTKLNAQELMNVSRHKMRQNQAAQKAKDASEPGAKKTRKKKIGQAVFSKQVVARKPPGRPPELNLETAERICEHLRAGLFIQSALQAERVLRRTYYKWMEQAERDAEAGENSIFSEFLHMIKKVEVEVERKNLEVVQSGTFGWQGAAWTLERRFPARWGNRMRLSLEEAQDFARKLMGVLVEEVSDQEVLERIVTKIRTIQGEQRDLLTAGSHVR